MEFEEISHGFKSEVSAGGHSMWVFLVVFFKSNKDEIMMILYGVCCCFPCEAHDCLVHTLPDIPNGAQKTKFGLELGLDDRDDLLLLMISRSKAESQVVGDHPHDVNILLQ